MIPNDCLRRIRYILDLKDEEVITIFEAAGQTVSKPEIVAWLKKEADAGYEQCSDEMFATFLNGLIISRRGKKDGPQPEPEKMLNNNIIFRKLKIAFNLQAEEILEILSLADLNVSKHELSAFFRRKDHKHYRDCEDQILRNFLMGLQIKFRGAPVS